VASDDTAFPLSAGCPVIVKAHSDHSRAAELVGRAVQKAVRNCGLPEGVFSLLFGSAGAIVQTWLLAVASRLSALSIRVILMFNALAEHGADISRAFVASLIRGAGQFCNNTGLTLAIEAFVASTSDALSNAAAQITLSLGIFQSFYQGVTSLKSHLGVTTLAIGRAAEIHRGQTTLLSTSASGYTARYELRQDVFGAASPLPCASLAVIKLIRIPENVWPPVAATMGSPGHRGFVLDLAAEPAD